MLKHPINKTIKRYMKLSVAFLCLSAQFRLFAQQNQSHAMLAASFCQQLNMQQAINEIEIAVKDEEESRDMYTWYVRGFVYKEQYKITSAESDRETAVQSFLKSKELAGNDEDVNMNHNVALTYLANTYYNDAVMLATTIERETETLCEKYFNNYINLIKIAKPSTDLTENYSAYYLTLAQRYFDLWMTSKNNLDYYEKALKNYSLTCTLNPHDCTAHYNIVVLQYNHMLTADELLLDKKENLAQAENTLLLIDKAKAVCNEAKTLEALAVAEKYFASLKQKSLSKD